MAPKILRKHISKHCLRVTNICQRTDNLHMKCGLPPLHHGDLNASSLEFDYSKEKMKMLVPSKRLRGGGSLFPCNQPISMSPGQQLCFSCVPNPCQPVACNPSPCGNFPTICVSLQPSAAPPNQAPEGSDVDQSSFFPGSASHTSPQTRSHGTAQNPFGTPSSYVPPSSAREDNMQGALGPSVLFHDSMIAKLTEKFAGDEERVKEAAKELVGPKFDALRALYNGVSLIRQQILDTIAHGREIRRQLAGAGSPGDKEQLTQMYMAVIGKIGELNAKLNADEEIIYNLQPQLIAELVDVVASPQVGGLTEQTLGPQLHSPTQISGFGSAPNSTNRSGSRVNRSGSPINPFGSSANRSGSPVNRSGFPANRSGSPVNRSGSPANRSGSPVNRSGSPKNPFGSPESRSASFINRSLSPPHWTPPQNTSLLGSSRQSSRHSSSPMASPARSLGAPRTLPPLDHSIPGHGRSILTAAEKLKQDAKGRASKTRRPSLEAWDSKKDADEIKKMEDKLVSYFHDRRNKVQEDLQRSNSIVQ